MYSGSVNAAVQRREFIISCVIAGVCGVLCWSLGLVGSVALFFSQFGFLSSIPLPLMQLTIAIGFGVAGRYGLEYGLLASIYLMDIAAKGLQKLNRKMKTDKARYVEDSKNLKIEVSVKKNRAFFEYGPEQAKFLAESLEKLENMFKDAEFDSLEKLTQNSPNTKLNLYAWELEKFEAIKDHTLTYQQFQQQVDAYVQDPSKLKLVGPRQ